MIAWFGVHSRSFQALEVNEYHYRHEREEEDDEECRLCCPLSYQNKIIEKCVQECGDDDAERNEVVAARREERTGEKEADKAGGKRVEQICSQEAVCRNLDADRSTSVQDRQEKEEVFECGKPHRGRNHIDHGIHRFVKVRPPKNSDFHGKVFGVFLNERDAQKKNYGIE